MARPAHVFSADEARSLILGLSIAVKKDSGTAFIKNLKLDLLGSSEQQYQALFNAQESIEVLYKKHCRWDNQEPAVDAPAELKAWIDAHLSPAGWTRIQAARRQKKHSRNNREKITKIKRETSWDADELAKEAGISKKECIEQLVAFMQDRRNATLRQAFIQFCKASGPR